MGALIDPITRGEINARRDSLASSVSHLMFVMALMTAVSK
jgi:chromosome segregation and condensation protein ScpB